MLKKITLKPILPILALVNFLCFTEDIVFVAFALSIDAALIYYRVKVNQIEKEWSSNGVNKN